MRPWPRSTVQASPATDSQGSAPAASNRRGWFSPMVKMKKAPAAPMSRACSRWVCIWSAVITVPARSGIFFSSWRKTGISFVFLTFDRELGGGGAVVPDPRQQHRGTPAAGGAAHRFAVDPQVAAHAGPQRAGPGSGPRAQRVVVLALVTAGQYRGRGWRRPGGGASRSLPSGAPSRISSSPGAVAAHSAAASSSPSPAMPATSGSASRYSSG